MAEHVDMPGRANENFHELRLENTMYVKKLNLSSYALLPLRYLHLRNNLKHPLSQLKQKQWDSFRNIVDFAWRRVPLYQRHFKKAGFHPSDLKSFGNIRDIPKIQKKTFQLAESSDCIADSYKPSQLVKGRTSGSSGYPLGVYYTKEDWIYRTLLHLRILFHNGMKFHDKIAHISDVRHSSDFEYFFQRLGFLSKTFVFIGDNADLQLRKMSEINPSIIYSYASNMTLLSDTIKAAAMCPIKPRLIFTTAELLTPEDRRIIEDAFSAPLRDIYGAVEMGDIAWQCPYQDGYHVNIDSFLIEVETDGRPSQPGESGKIIITNLHSLAMPFIRYELDDVVTVPEEEPCPCGCTFPRIRVLNGRSDDWLYTADGKRVSPLIFVIASIPGVGQYRVRQKAYDHLIIEILPGRDFNEHTLRLVRDHIVDVMGVNQKIEVRRKEHIPKEAGKMRRVISDISV
jgi:phenylacetate-CoA ligase